MLTSVWATYDTAIESPGGNMSITRSILFATATAFMIAGAGTGVATAAPVSAVLGGGSGIVFGNEVCSLTTIGHDASGRLVGLTAGHCAAVGTPVKAETTPAAGVLGVVVARNTNLDYEVIQFDPSKVIPVRTVAGTTIAGIGSYPGTGDVVCKNGRTTGHDCGVVWGDRGIEVINQTCSQPGDSGGPVTVGDRLVGMNNGHLGSIGPIPFNVVCSVSANPIQPPAITHPIADILHSIDVGGGPGAGFQPI